MRVDLHIHTCLSPCASLDMGPRDIARVARERGLEAIGVVDHNSARNAPAVVAACRAEGVRCWPGIEVTTREEAHVLWLHDTAEAAVRAGEWVYDHLPDLPNVPATFGDQVVVDADERVVEFLPRLLTNAADLTLSQIGVRAREWGGLLVAAHVDRPMYSVVSQLGMLPDDVPFDAVEYTVRAMREGRARRPGVPAVVSSDAHELDQIGQGWIRVEGGVTDLASLSCALREGRCYGEAAQATES